MVSEALAKEDFKSLAIYRQTDKHIRKIGLVHNYGSEGIPWNVKLNPLSGLGGDVWTSLDHEKKEEQVDKQMD